MKHDGERAVIWSKMHWQIARIVCVCIPILAMILTALDWLTREAAFFAALVAVSYVLLLTWNYTRDNEKKQQGVS